ncbi:hypothetical protein [Kitasatospora sp. NPDC097691]|uniref:hypothetical protein n=1 Tax=Kitasatospora sp. NPDC097691 TaxID=3157231 RepID=UPI0033244DC5
MTLAQHPSIVPPLWRPLQRLHHRAVEKRTAAAAKDLRTVLGRPLDVSLLRRALVYHYTGSGLTKLFMAVLLAGGIAQVILAAMQGACTPGGHLPAAGQELGPCPTHGQKVGLALIAGSGAVALVALSTLSNSWSGARFRPCFGPVLPALDVLRACARLCEPGAGHAEAAELSVKAQALGQALVDAAGRAATDYGSRVGTRATLRNHAKRVAALLERTADQLLPDRERATRELAVLASAIAEQTADGCFTDLLGSIGQPPELPTNAPESPDRADGRRLAIATVTALLLTTALAVTVGLFGLPAFVTAPLAVFTVPLLTFLLLSFRHGLTEALRLVAVLRTVRGENSVEPTAVAEGEATTQKDSDPTAGSAD